MDKITYPRTIAAGFAPVDSYKKTAENYGLEYPFDGDLSTLLRNKKFEEVAYRLDLMYEGEKNGE